MHHESVGKQTVCKEWVVRSFHKELAGVILYKLDRFWIIGILIFAAADICFEHFMKHLEDIPDHDVRVQYQQGQKRFKVDHASLLEMIQPFVQMIQCAFYIQHDGILACPEPVEGFSLRSVFGIGY